jgi:hypothetical protein
MKTKKFVKQEDAVTFISDMLGIKPRHAQQAYRSIYQRTRRLAWWTQMAAYCTSLIPATREFGQ